MSKPGVNAAVTEDGARYNKLKRPDDLYTATAPTKTESTCTTPLLNESSKRTLDEADIDDDGDEEPSKRSRMQNLRTAAFDQNRSRVYHPPADNGQQSMFPGLIDDGDVSDDSMNEALAYLRSVRNEASTIPNLLVATAEEEQETSNRFMYHNGRGDYNVIYEDGTWIARDTTPDEYPHIGSSDAPGDLDPQEQYYRRLLRRYETMRTTLNGAGRPTSALKTELDASKRMASEIPKGRHGWLYSLDREYPTTSLVYNMREADVFMGLKYCAHSLDRFTTITKQKSCWIWALLAKAPESGTMDYEKVGCIRDLGHKAGQFGMRLRNGLGNKTESDQDEEEDESAWEEYDTGTPEDWETWEEDETGVAEYGEAVEGGKASETPESKRVVQSYNEADADSDAEMSISSDEGEIQEDTPSGQPKSETARAGLIAQCGNEDHSGPPQDSSKLSQNAVKDKETASDDGPTTLAEARARLLAQLGDRLVHPDSEAVPQNPSSTELRASEERKKRKSTFSSRAEAERHRIGLADSVSNGQAIAEETAPKEEVDTTAIGAAEPTPDMPDLNSKVTIDMILTVVAECYGQRDLLRFRDTWAAR